MLQTDPSVRPNINEVMFHLENIAQTRSVELASNLNFLKKTDALLHHTASLNPTITVESHAHAAPASTQANNSQSNWMGNAASLFKGNSLMQSIKDASSKVIDSVQYGSFFN